MSYMFSYVFMVDFSSMSRFSCCNFSSTDSDTCHFRAVELTEATQVTGDGTSCHLSLNVKLQCVHMSQDYS